MLNLSKGELTSKLQNLKKRNQLTSEGLACPDKMYKNIFLRIENVVNNEEGVFFFSYVI